MMTVEDCLQILEAICRVPSWGSANDAAITNTWDRRFICDVGEHVNNGAAISTAQSTLVLKLIDRYRFLLVAEGVQDSELTQLLAYPQYRKPPYQSEVLPREVRWIGDNKLVFRCKFNQGVVEDIKRLKGTNYFLPYQFPSWHKEHKLWVVDVNSGNHERVMDVIKRHNFGFDDAVAQFFLDIENGRVKRSEVEANGDSIVVTVRNDDFLNAWLNALQTLVR